MSGKAGKVMLSGLLLLMILFPAMSQAEELPVEEGVTTQGDFALWVVKEVGALSKLPPAATGQDAVDFLTSLGVVPEAGWKKDEAVTREFLLSLLAEEEAEELKNLSLKELLAKIRDAIQTLISDRKLGVFRAAGQSASGSVPA